MASTPADPAVFSWSSPASPLRIEYSAEAMEEIRARAVEGFYRLTRGGVEIAGLLLGSVQEGSARILAQLPFEIEYAYGPVFALSPRDIAYLRKLLEDLANPHSAPHDQARGLRVLGFYVSHSRSGLALTEGEFSLYQQLFPHAWQSVLLLKPSRSPETAAAFFVRGANGEVCATEPRDTFVVTPAMGERRARPPRGESHSLQALAEAARSSAPPENPLPATPERPRASGRAPAQPESVIAQGKLFSDEDQLAGGAWPVPPESIAPPAPSPSATEPAHAGPERMRPPLSRVLSTALGPDAIPSESTAAPGADSFLLSASTDAISAERAPSPSPSAGPPLNPIPTGSDAPPAEADTAAVPDWHEEAASATAPRATSWLRWAIPGIGFVLLLVLGYLVYHALNSVPPSVVFYTKDAGEKLEIIWQLKGLSDARTAQILIQTGDQTRRIDLIRTGQLSGTFSSPYLTRDAEVWLEVERYGGEVIRRKAPVIPSDSVVAYLGGEAVRESTSSAPTKDSQIEAIQPPPSTVEPPPAKSVPATLVPEPILATPVEAAATARNPIASPERKPDGPARLDAANPQPTGSRALTPREEAQQRSDLRPSGAVSTAPRDPEAPVQARVTEAAPTPAPRQETASASIGQPASNPVQSVASAVQPPVRLPQGPSVASPAPTTGAASPATRLPEPAAERISPPAQSPASAQKPAARPTAGRMIWTGQLRKNQSLQITGKDANQGVLNASLPGQPVRINVLPGELTAQGLVVYTANPRYRNAQNAVEPPGPTNGWNQTRYRYDPARANSLIVTGVPSQANGWSAITVRNDDKPTNVIVIDWQAAEP
jgi:hypothetical protein